MGILKIFAFFSAPPRLICLSAQYLPYFGPAPYPLLSPLPYPSIPPRPSWMLYALSLGCYSKKTQIAIAT